MRLALMTTMPSTHVPMRSGVDSYSKYLASALRERIDTIDILSPGTHHDPSVHAIRWGVAGYVDAWKKIRVLRPDVAHIQHELFLYGGMVSAVLFPFFAWAINRLVPTVITLHHVISLQSIGKNFNRDHTTWLPPAIARVGFRYFYRLIDRSGATFIVHHPMFKEVLVSEYGIESARIAIVEHGVSDGNQPVQSAKELFGIPHDAHAVFGFFGFIDPRKDVAYMIEEFITFAHKHPHAFLVIAGELHPRLSGRRSYDAYIEQLRKLASTGGKNIIWIGALPEKNIQPFLRTIDCLILPYQSIAGASSVLSRAVGMNVPFLASSPMAPFVRNGSLLFDLAPGSLVAKMEAFHERDLHTESRIDNHLAELRQDHSWEDIAEQTTGVYGRTTRFRRSPLVLVGAYGQGNLGDELLLASCLEAAGRDTCAVISSNAANTAREHDVRTIDKASSWNIIRAIRQSRGIVVGGGDQCKLLKASQRRRPYSLLLHLLALSLACRVFRKPLVLLGIGIGNVGTSLATRITRICCTLATTVTLRDNESTDWLRTHAPHAYARTTADLVWLRHTPPYEPATAPVLGIAPAFQLDRADAAEHVLQSLREASDRFLENDNANTLRLLPFWQSGDVHDDLHLCETLHRDLRHAKRATIESGLSLANVDETYASLRWMWGMRLHSLHMACMHEIPFIALIYDVKIRNFLADIDCEEWGIELDADFSADKLLALQQRLADREQDVRTTLRTHGTRLRANAAENRDILSRLTHD